MLPEEEERQKGLEHLHFPPQDNKVLVLSRPEEVRAGLGVPPLVYPTLRGGGGGLLTDPSAVVSPSLMS